MKDWLSELRLHQWSKNILIAVPLLLGHIAGDPASAIRSIAGILVFGLVASTSYIMNDLADIEADRQHPTKRNRAIAASRISVVQGGAPRFCC